MDAHIRGSAPVEYCDKPALAQFDQYISTASSMMCYSAKEHMLFIAEDSQFLKPRACVVPCLVASDEVERSAQD